MVFLLPAEIDLQASEMNRVEVVEDFGSALSALLPDLRAHALKLTHNPNEVDDLVQDTLERAWMIRDRARSALKPWCFAIMRNVNGNHITANKRHYMVPLGLVHQLEQSVTMRGELTRLRRCQRQTSEHESV